MAQAVQEIPQRIGRFEIVRLLGRGAEGTVYLANDTRLGRHVALKTISPHGASGLGVPGMTSLIDESRIVATLSHPNIVTLFDAGEEDGTPYLVFEYVEGSTLAMLIRESHRLDVVRAVEIAVALADGVACAHERHIVHRDLKPGNVMITPAGVPRLMDFGIARRGAPPLDESTQIVGTPAYMAPEYIAHGIHEAAADVFALGVILYEMLTGTTPARGRDARETVRAILAHAFDPPSKRNARIDARLEAIVTKALAKAPDERYASAAAMAHALRDYLMPVPDESDAKPSGKGTLDYLLRRIRHKGDFPALSATIMRVSRAASSEREPVAVLREAVMKDFALTSRLLKVVNASHLRQFGGEIGTVSRAIAILGYDTVRSTAMSLLLFEHMHDRANVAALRDQVVAAHFSGLIGRHLAEFAGLRGQEQAFIGAMFHRLGSLLATFYLHEEAQLVERLVQTRGLDEERASVQVLGLSYEQLGIGVAKAWNFPAEITDSMRAMAGPVKKCPSQQGEKLRLVANASQAVADVFRQVEPARRKAELAHVFAQYGAALQMTERQLAAIIEGATESLIRDGDALGAGVLAGGFVKRLREARGAQPVREDSEATVAMTAAASTEVADVAETAAPDVKPTAPGPMLPAAPPNAAPADIRSAPAPSMIVAPNPDPMSAAVATTSMASSTADTVPITAPLFDAANRHAALAAGVQDVTQALISEQAPGDVLRLLLQTMYRGMGFRRVLFFHHDARQRVLRCRMGFGADADRLVQRAIAAPLHAANCVFYAAAVKGADVSIEDVDHDKVRAFIPGWHRAAMPARGLLLLPVIDRKATLALIYADTDVAGSMRFNDDELRLLKTLRNQAVLALRLGR
ncbi:MAG TPA: protein kinase [Burkholderiaceae bacterium]|nr:protein kinase [Burkholderiaceae bacterium]